VELKLPSLYAIVDAEVLSARSVSLNAFACDLSTAGVNLLQYRDKSSPPQDILRAAAILREAMANTPCKLILNDRPDLALLANFDGVHVGQDDLSPEDARLVFGSSQKVLGPNRIVGISTHTDAQVQAANLTSADYIAIGPVFSTSTKPDAEPVIGLEGVRRARALTAKPLVAIGGITRANARSVIDAGADSIAVISALLSPTETTEAIARDFLARLR
jgi:thiamine-phosphate pyrophosphorylase